MANHVQLINFVKCIVFMDIVSEMHIFAAFGGDEFMLNAIYANFQHWMQ